MILWCADGLTEEERAAWNDKVVTITERIAQYKHDVEVHRHNIQVTEADKATLTEEEYTATMEEDKKALYESTRNVHSDERMLEKLLNNGPQDNTEASSSTAGTARNISEVSGSNEEGPSKKK